MKLQELKALKEYTEGFDPDLKLTSDMVDGQIALNVRDQQFTNFQDAAAYLSYLRYEAERGVETSFKDLPWGIRIIRESCCEGIQY